jgi:hypothetical protein
LASAASCSINPPASSASRTAIRSSGVSSITSTFRGGSQATLALLRCRRGAGWALKGTTAPLCSCSGTVISLASRTNDCEAEIQVYRAGRSNWAKFFRLLQGKLEADSAERRARDGRDDRRLCDALCEGRITMQAAYELPARRCAARASIPRAVTALVLNQSVPQYRTRPARSTWTGTLCTSKQLVHFPVLTRFSRLLETKIPPATPGGTIRISCLRPLSPLPRERRGEKIAQCANGSGRTWKCTAIGFMPLPPSWSHGVRSPLEVHKPRPFQPAFGSSIRPSRPLA